MRPLYTLIFCFVISICVTKKGFSQSVNVPYQFYLDANNNCVYDPSEAFLYNLPGSLTFSFVNTSSVSANLTSSTTCFSSITINNPQLPPVNSFIFVPSMPNSYNTFSINPGCTAYTNLSYTTTNYLPIQSVGPISNMFISSNITGFNWVVSTNTIFTVCNNLVNDSIDIYFNYENIYTCAGVNTSRTYSICIDGNTIDVVTVNASMGSNYVMGALCKLNETYWNPQSTISIRTKLSSTGLTPGNHLFALKSTPLYTSTLSALNYTCMLSAVPCCNLSGTIYEDCDNNCSLGTGDGGTNYAAYVRLFNATNSYSIYPNYFGNYSGLVPTGSSQYSITSVPASVNYTPCTSATQTYAIPSLTYTPYNFGYKVSGYVDPNVSAPVVPGGVWPGQTRTITCGWQNSPVANSCSTVFPVNSGKYKMVLDKNFSYQSAFPAPNAVVAGPTGDTIVWNIANFNVTNYNFYAVVAQMSSTVSIGTGYTNYAIIAPSNDNVLTNNFSVFNFTVGLPLDPNNKLSWASGIKPNGDMPLATQDMYYTINFQNIGTAYATNVKCADTLDSNLDWNTLQVLSSSAPVQAQIDNATGISVFIFNGIYLPDSTSNEPGSHGYVQYKIKLKPSVPVNTIIKNRAHNYFDYQPAVPTNQTKNKLVIFSGIDELEKANSVFVAPNPVSDKVTISSKEIIQSVSVFNNLGQIVLKQDVNALQSQMDLSQITDGVYFIQIQLKDGVKTTRKVVKN